MWELTIHTDSLFQLSPPPFFNRKLFFPQIQCREETSVAYFQTLIHTHTPVNPFPRSTQKHLFFLVCFTGIEKSTKNPKKNCTVKEKKKPDVPQKFSTATNDGRNDNHVTNQKSPTMAAQGGSESGGVSVRLSVCVCVCAVVKVHIMNWHYSCKGGAKQSPVVTLMVSCWLAMFTVKTGPSPQKARWA